MEIVSVSFKFVSVFSLFLEGNKDLLSRERLFEGYSIYLFDENNRWMEEGNLGPIKTTKEHR